MVRLSLTFPLLAVLSVVSSSLAMRIDARPPTDRVQLSRRQFSVPSISQAQYNAGVQSQCQELQPELQVGSNTIQGDISSIQSVTSNIENEFEATFEVIALLEDQGVAAGQQLSVSINVIVQQWEDFLDGSGTIADTIVDNLQVFVNEIVPQMMQFASSGNSADAIQVLKNFQTAAGGLSTQSQPIPGNFRSLQSSMQSFVASVPSSVSTPVPDMINELNQYIAIWSAVQADSQLAINAMSAIFADGTPAIGPEIFWPFIEGMQCIYQPIISSLQNYASAINGF